MRRRKIILSLLSFMGICTTTLAQTGYIYVHKKAISEVASTNFTFNLTDQNNVLVKNFQLNDKPTSIGNAFDIGNSHGAGEGQLWVVINGTNYSQDVHNVTGTLYTRSANAANWRQTAVTTARSVDGIDAETAVYSDETGNVFIYNNGTSVKIWDKVNHASLDIVDVASGGTNGVIAVVASDGSIYKYIGAGNNDLWSKFTNVNAVTSTGSSGTVTHLAYRLDIQPSTGNIYFIRNNQFASISKISSVDPSTAVITSINGGTATPDPSRDIAISNDGTIFASFGEYIHSKKETDASWVRSGMTRRLYGLTAGSGDQAWSINKNNSTLIDHTIYTKASAPVPANTEPVWIDDERVRTTDLGNSIMIPVASGTYKLSELDIPNWSNSEIVVYDPTNNSTVNLTNNEATINVAANEVVNVVYSNSLSNPIAIPTACKTNYVVTFGSDTSTPPGGSAIQGFTSYHYKNGNNAADGYYIVTKNNSGWWGNPPTTLLTDHSVDANGNPVNGYFAIFNASYSKDDFFRQTVTGLVVGVKYELAFWVADVGNKFEIRPNVTMGIVDPVTGIAMATPLDTGDITSTQWKRYSYQFVATATTAEIYLKNNAMGGNGNDLAIDDISFQPAPGALNPITPPNGLTILCSSRSSNANQYQFTIVPPTTGGTGVWTALNPNLVTINPTTGLATAVYGASGTTEIIYSFTSTAGCLSQSVFAVTVGNCVCYDPVTNMGTPNTTKHGITLLGRAGSDNGGWPTNRPSAHTVLESNTQGFVPTRLTATQITSISNPQEGMMVYDTTNNCLKIYSVNPSNSSEFAWSCFNTQTCP